MKRFESNQLRIKQYRAGFVVLYILQELIAGGTISVQSHPFICYGYTTLFTLITFTGKVFKKYSENLAFERQTCTSQTHKQKNSVDENASRDFPWDF